MTIGKRIKEARKMAGMTQFELAEKIGVTRASVLKWESDGNHGTVPDLENLIKLSEVLNVDIGYLLGISGKNPIALVHDITGLSEDAVATLVRWKNGKPADKVYLSVLSTLLSRREAFAKVLASIWNYCVAPQEHAHRRNAGQHNTAIDTGKPNTLDVLRYSAALAFADLLRLVRKNDK